MIDSFPLQWPDLLVLLLYFAAVLVIGWRLRKGQTDMDQFVVGGRGIPWFAVLGSIIATEISAATFVGVPATGFDGNLNYLQMGLGSLLARFAVGFFFLTVFYQWGVMTVYGYLDKRFGPNTRTTSTLFFLLGRTMASGARLLMATTALAVIFEIPLALSLFLFTALAVVYTSLGGIRAIIWTDLLQATVFIGGALAVTVFLQVEIGWGRILEEASANGKLEIFRWSPASGDSGSWLSWINDPMLIYVAVLNGFIGTMAALGTDQDLTQRMLTCRDSSLARRSVILSGFIGIPVAGVFLLLGMGLVTYFNIHPDITLPLLPDGSVESRSIFPFFIREILPTGLKGLLVAGLFAAAMSSVDSALGALSSSAALDLYKPLVRPQATEKEMLRLSRRLILLFAILLASFAWLLRDTTEFLFLTFKLASIPSGALLGIFLLGLATDRGSDRSCLLAMLTGSACTALALILIESGILPLAWSWLILLNTILTLTTALFVDRLNPQKNNLDLL